MDWNETEAGPSQKNTPITLSVAQKHKLIKACAVFSAKDMRPFDTVEKNGFIEMATELFNLGAYFKKAISTENMRNILPHRNAVRNRVVAMGKENTENAKTAIKEILARDSTLGIGFSTDIWTETFDNVGYISLTAHYVAGRSIKNALLYLKPMNTEDKKSDKVQKELEEMIETIGIKENFKRSVFVTDRGGNIKKALKDANINGIPCFAHLLNNLCENSLLKTEEIEKFVNLMKEAVTWFKKSSQMSELETRLKQQAKTRFNSIKAMLESVKANFPDMLNTLKDENHELASRIEKAKIETIDQLLPFLVLLEKFTKQTEGENYPTLYKVWPAVTELKTFCDKPIQNEPRYITKMKKIATKYIDENFEITIYHELATFLTPKHKSLEFIDTDSQRKQNVVTKLRDYYNVIKAERESLQESVEIDPNDPFAEAYDKNNFLETSDMNEVDEYLNMQVDNTTKCLDFWCDNTLRFPILSSIAYFMHSIHATSCTEERIFSSAGHIKNVKRNRIDIEDLAHMVAARKEL